jgi:glyoxylase-like metal-dependent hydrolase (beta-lactamase superfamily II)
MPVADVLHHSFDWPPAGIAEAASTHSSAARTSGGGGLDDTERVAWQETDLRSPSTRGGPTISSHLMQLGSVRLQPISDGFSRRVDPSDIFADARPHEWQRRVSLDHHGHLELALTCLLVGVSERLILIDTGYGAQPERPEVGQLNTRLAELGIASDDIDTVVLSHGHGDHIGGATLGMSAAARPAFPSARYWLGRADWDYFSTAERRRQEPHVVDKLLPLAAAQCLDLADVERDIAPGVRLLPLPGHTPGHMGVAISSGREVAIYVGDLVHHALQIEHPEWSAVWDALPVMARQTRGALLDRARRERSLVLSYHLPFPGIGRVGASGWEPTLG